MMVTSGLTLWKPKEVLGSDGIILRGECQQAVLYNFMNSNTIGGRLCTPMMT